MTQDEKMELLSRKQLIIKSTGEYVRLSFETVLYADTLKRAMNRTIPGKSWILPGAELTEAQAVLQAREWFNEKVEEIKRANNKFLTRGEIRVIADNENEYSTCIEVTKECYFANWNFANVDKMERIVEE